MTSHNISCIGKVCQSSTFQYKELTIEKKERKFKLLKVVLGLVFTLIIGIFTAIIIAYTGIAEPKLVSLRDISRLPELINNIQDSKEWRIHYSFKAKFRNKGFKSGFIDKIEIEPTGLTDYPEVEVIKIDKTPIKWRKERIITYEVILKMDWEYVKNKIMSKYEFKQLFYDNTGEQVDWMTVTLHSSWFKDLLEYSKKKPEKETTIFVPPIPKDIKSPDPLGIFNFDPIYNKARSSMLAEDYKKAADLFKSIYEIKPDYPTLALYYGKCLNEIGKNDEAIAVWLSITPNEKYKFINSDIGGLLFNLKRYKESVKYFKLALNDYKRSDVLYWDSRAFLIMAKNKKMSINHFINDVDEFVEVVDNDLKNLVSYKVKKDTKFEIDNDEVRNAILGRKYNAFILLHEVSLGIIHKKKNYNESLNYALRAADHLEGPVFGVAHLFGGSIQKDEQYNIIDKQIYLKFLQDLSLILWHVKNRDHDMSKLNSIMERIENHNNNSKNQEISDFAMLIRSFYGDSKSIRKVKKANFKIIYSMMAESGSGWKILSIESPNYLLGKKEIDIEGNKKYRYDQVININPEVVLNEKPYFRATFEDINGRKMHYNPHPWIEIKDNK